MSRRQRKKAIARPTSPEAPPKVLHGADALMDRLVRDGISRERLARGLAEAVVRFCGSSPDPDRETCAFFAQLGEAIGADDRLGRSACLVDRYTLALQAAFFEAAFCVQLVSSPD